MQCQIALCNQGALSFFPYLPRCVAVRLHVWTDYLLASVGLQSFSDSGITENTLASGDAFMDIDTETSVLSDLTPRDSSVVNASEQTTLEEKPSISAAPSEKELEVANPHAEANAAPSAPAEATSATRPTILTTVASAPSNPSIVTPHPKKFTAVNINKKFLQKNSASPITASPASANSPSLKSGSLARKP